MPGNIWKVKKRNGRIVDFDPQRAATAVEKALKATYTTEAMEYKRELTAKVAAAVSEKLADDAGKGPVPVERIQDVIEGELMSSGEFAAAKCYILYRERHKHLRKSGRNMPASAMSDYIFISRYARHNKEGRRRESWDESVDRVRDMHIRKLPLIKDRLEWAVRACQTEKASSVHALAPVRAAKPSSSKTSGSTTAPSRAATVSSSSARPCICYYAASGVGFSVEYEHIEKLPKLADRIDEGKVLHHSIKDTIEGWADAVDVLIGSYLKGSLVEFNYSLLRPQGSASENLRRTRPRPCPRSASRSNASAACLTTRWADASSP